MCVDLQMQYLPDMPCKSVDVIIDVFAFISSIRACCCCCCSALFLASIALHGVYPDDTTGYIHRK